MSNILNFAKDLVTTHASLMRTTVLIEGGEAEVCLNCDGRGFVVVDAWTALDCPLCSGDGLLPEDIESLLAGKELEERP